VTITPVEPAVTSPQPQVTPVIPVKPSNHIDFGQVRKLKHRGIALLSVTVPGPGSLGLSGADLVVPKGFTAAGTKALTGAGKVRLLIKVKGKSKRTLQRTGRLKVNVSVTFTPTGGDPSTLQRSLTLVRVP
jgi:hypothetical protein